MLKKVLLLITLLTFTTTIGVGGFLFIKNKQAIIKNRPNLQQAVLAATAEAPHFIFKVNVPSFFNDTAHFTKDVNIEGGLNVQGKALFNSSISLNNNNLDLGTGTLTASNVLYGLKAGNGVTVSSGQTPTIAVTSTGVTSLQSQTGALTLTAGSGISIDGLKISATNTTQNIFKTISDGSNSFSAGSDSDTLTLKAGSGMTITTDTSNKKLTFTATGGTGTVTGSGFTTDGIMYATGDSAITSLTPGTSGYILQSNGTGVAPSWIANSGSNPSFANISTGTNTSATMTVGNGATMTYTGTGVLNANELLGSTWTSPSTIGSTTPNTGAFTTLSASSTLSANGGLTIASGQNLLLSGFTSGSVPYINSSKQLAEDNSNFFWDATNKRLGIGTTNPSTTLHVLNTTATDQNPIVEFGDGSSSTRYQFLADRGGGSVFYMNGGLTNIRSNGSIGFQNSNTTNMYISSTGNIGIGTTSPLNSTGLDIEKNSLGNAALVVNNSGGAGDIFTASSAGTTQFVINKNGNVGIGTANPTSPLYINGNANDMVVMNSSLDAGFIRPFEMLDSSMTSGHNLVYHVGHDLGTNDTAYFGFNYQGANSSNNFITLGMWGADNLVNINAGGNVGIATTTPKNKLDVVGNAAIGSYAGTNTAPSNSLIVSGNVGIGNNNPSNVLDVNGSANDMVVLTSTLNSSFIRPLEMLDSSMTAGQNLVYHVGHDTTTNNTTYIGFHYAGSGNPENWLTMGFWGNDNIYNFTPSGHVGFGTTSMGNGALAVNQINNAGDLFSASASGTTKFVINYSGNVGIGTNNPQQKLQISSGNFSLDNAQAIYLDGPTDGAWKMGREANPSGAQLLTTAATVLTTQSNANEGLMVRNAAGTSLFEMQGSDGKTYIKGNVGIGTSSPQRALHVLGTSVFDNSNNPSDWTDPVSLIRANSSQNDWLWFHTGAPSSIGSSTIRWGWGMTGGTDDLFLRNGNTTNSFLGQSDSVLRISRTTGNLALGFSESIGTISPLASTGLDIETNSLGNSALVVNNSGGAGDIFTASSSGTPVFNINKNGNTRITGSLCVKATFTTACAGSTAGTIYATNTTVQAADVAENYVSSQTLEPGDLIMPAADGDNQAVLKTTSAYQSQTIGVVSTKPGVTLNSDAQTNDSHPNLYPIALQGRVPVKVSSINGIIHTGDLLTSSSIPGIAMKATKAGQIIGKALEDYTDNNTMDIGKIMTFVNIAWADPTMQIAITDSGNISLNGQPLNPTTTTLSTTVPATNTYDITTLKDQVASLSAQIGQINELSKQLSAIEKNININQTLQASSSSGLDLSTESTTVLGNFTIAGRTTLNDLGITGKITDGLLSINGLDETGTPTATINTLSAPLKVQSLAINGVDFENGKLTIDTNGNLTTNANITANSITTDKLNITTDKTATDSGILSSSTGTVSIEAGTNNIDVQTTSLTSKSLIFLTPNLPVAVGYKLKNNNTFNIYLQDPAQQNLKINWWIIN